MEDISLQELINEVIAWRREKNINNQDKQLLKIHEEVSEVNTAIYEEQGEKAIKTEVGDVFITSIVFADMMGYDVKECIELAHNKNIKRKGQLKGGSWVKEED